MPVRRSPLNRWAGRSLALASLVAPLALATLPATAAAPALLHINFQPATAAVPTGYTADTGAAYNGTSGWQDASGAPLDLTANTRVRGSALSPDSRYDTQLLMQETATSSGNKTPGTWVHALANGTYAVTVAVGDPTAVNSVNRITAELGTPNAVVLVNNVTPTSTSLFDTVTANVTVSDGSLSLSAAGGTNTKLDFVDALPAGAPSIPLPTSVHVNFAMQTSTAVPGYVTDYGLPWTADAGFGWENAVDGTPVSLVGNGRDRGSPLSPDKRYDTLVAMQQTPQASSGTQTPGRWEHALANGSYDVTVGVGDATAANSVYRISAESGSPDAVTIINNVVPTATSLFATATQLVTVADGRLTLDANGGGVNTKIDFVDAVPVPDAPTAVTASVANGMSTVAWTAPVFTGGSAVTGYTVTASPGGATATTTGATWVTVRGLTDGTPYTFSVTAANAVGAGPASVASAPVAPSATPAGRVMGKLSPATGAYFGATSEDEGVPTDDAQWDTWIQGREALAGRHWDIVNSFPGWATPLASTRVKWDISQGIIPMISWNSPTTYTDAQITAGAQDAVITAQAQSLKALGSQVFLRFDWEMNGNWFAWDGTHNNDPGTTDGPAKFIAMWRHVHDIFTAVGATNVVWVWCANPFDVTSDAWNHWTNYYPGDAYVDWVSADQYNWAAQPTPNYQPWTEFAPEFTQFYNDYAGRKPIVLAETASAEAAGHDKGQWIANQQRSLETQFPDVQAVDWFDVNYQNDWMFDTSASSLAAYRVFGADPYFNPNGLVDAYATKKPS